MGRIWNDISPLKFAWTFSQSEPSKLHAQNAATELNLKVLSEHKCFLTCDGLRNRSKE